MIDRPVIKLENVSKSFGAFKALDAVSFDLMQGEVHCLAGMNGCGKSTLIKTINGVHTPDVGGTIHIDDQEYTSGLTPDVARAHGISVIWQDMALFDALTVWENIAFDSFVGRPFSRYNKRQAQDQAKDLLKHLGAEFSVDALVGDLAISNKQLVAICRSLARDARVIFMDEPTASLTDKESKNLLRVVKKLTDSDVSVVFVSHLLNEVLAISDRVTVIRDGKLVGTFQANDMNEADLAREMVGYDVDFERLTHAPLDEVILETIGLTRLDEFQNIDLKLRRGEVFGIVGRLGSGRTELALSLFGMSPPDSGEIKFKGDTVTLPSNRTAIDKGICYLSEDRLSIGLIQDQSIGENTILPVAARLTNSAGLIGAARRKALVSKWIEELEIKVQTADNPVSSLSGGNQQRVAISKWLACEPEVLILDLPTVGVDVQAKEGIYRIIRKLAEAGMALIVISDEVEEIYHNSHTVSVMLNGEFVFQTATSETSPDDLKSYLQSE